MFLFKKYRTPLIMGHAWIVGGFIFAVSVLFCMLPRSGRRFKAINVLLPYATLLSAGFLLAVLVLDFIPHTVSHEHGGAHDHKKAEFNTKMGLLISGISFLFLLGVDSCVLKHDHCDSEGDKSQSCESDDHKHECSVGKNVLSEETPHGIGNETVSITKHDHIKHSTSQDEGGCCDTSMIKNTNSKAKAFIFIIGISIHSFFEGLAFKTSGSFGNYELSILMHKVLESLSIGLAFLDTKFSFSVILFFTLFYSALTPFGMCLGHFFSDNQFSIADVSIFSICQGLALGSFLYIVFIEMISTAFHKAGNNKIKLSVLTFGYLIGSAIIISTPHEHSGGHHHHD